MSVTFSGLASGLDTAAIVESIMEVERVPITTMEDKQEYLESSLEVYEEFNTLLDTFSSCVMGLTNENDLAYFEVVNNGSDFFSISTSSISDEGSYAIEVVSLAQQQKDISTEGFADTDETTLSGELQLGDQTLSYEDLTLLELADLITESDNGISASITDVGTENGYHLLFPPAQDSQHGLSLLKNVQGSRQVRIASMSEAAEMGIYVSLGRKPGYLIYELQVPYTAPAGYNIVGIGFESGKIESSSDRERTGGGGAMTRGKGERSWGGGKRGRSAKSAPAEPFEMWATVQMADKASLPMR